MHPRSELARASVFSTARAQSLCDTSFADGKASHSLKRLWPTSGCEFGKASGAAPRLPHPLLLRAFVHVRRKIELFLHFAPVVRPFLCEAALPRVPSNSTGGRCSRRAGSPLSRLRELPRRRLRRPLLVGGGDAAQ